MSERPAIRMEMISDPRFLSGARELVSSVSRRLGFDDNASGKIALAVDEALCNVIRHGYKSATDRPIWLTLTPANGSDVGVCIVIEDEAPHVEPEQIKGRDLADVRPGGLGVHIIREVMDEVTFEKREPVGMRLMMKKWPPQPQPNAEGGRE